MVLGLFSPLLVRSVVCQCYLDLKRRGDIPNQYPSTTELLLVSMVSRCRSGIVASTTCKVENLFWNQNEGKK